LRVWGTDMGNKRPAFKTNTVFHVYNHGNGDDNIFREEENYRYFLKRYAHYIYPVAATYAFCLLPSHFHFMLKIRTEEKLTEFYREKSPKKDPQSFKNFADLVSRKFKNFLISYLKSFNNRYDRKGSLFLDNIRRKPVTNKNYYTHLVSYIHQNPVSHGFVNDLADWPFSSYSIILSRKQTQLERKEVLKWFGGIKSYKEMNQREPEINTEEFY